jgi:hypothetical protein
MVWFSKEKILNPVKYFTSEILQVKIISHLAHKAFTRIISIVNRKEEERLQHDTSYTHYRRYTDFYE